MNSFQSFFEHQQSMAEHTPTQAALLSDLCERLALFDCVTALNKVAALMVYPDLVHQRLRCDLLLHLAATHCRGTKKPSAKECAQWFNEIGASQFSSFEDNSEELFVQLVCGEKQGYRVLDGLWYSSAYYCEQILHVVENIPNHTQFDDLKLHTVAILRLSDRICERLKLPRNTPGKDINFEKLPQKVVSSLAHNRAALRFSPTDLDEIGISEDNLVPFISEISNFDDLIDQARSNSELVRKPIVRDGEMLVVVHPLAMSVAMRTHIIHHMIINDFQEEFLQAQTQTIKKRFDLCLNLGDGIGIPIHFQKGTKISAARKKVDEGRYAGFIFVLDKLTDFHPGGLISHYAPDEHQTRCIQYAFDQMAQEAHEAEFRGGVFFLIGSGIGRAWGYRHDLKTPEGWEVVHISEAEFYELCWAPEMSPSSIFSILEAQRKLAEMGVELINQSGFLNLVAWQKQDELKGHLLPHGQIEHDVTSENKLTVHIDPATIKKLRQQIKRRIDEHVVTDIRGHTHRVRKHKPSIFKEDETRSIYVTYEIQDPRERLSVFEGRCDWWIEINTVQSGDHAHQKWELVTVWLPRIAQAIEKKFPKLKGQQVQFTFKFLGAFPTAPEQRERASSADVLNSINTNFETGKKLVTIEIGQAFEDACAHPENIAEANFVRKWIEVALEYFDLPTDANIFEKLMREVVPSADARQTHAFEARDYRDHIRQHSLPKLVRLTQEENAYLSIGLSHGVKPIGTMHEFHGKTECTESLNAVVKRLETDLAQFVAQFNRNHLLTRLMENHEAAWCNQSTWKRTARAVNALHTNLEDVSQKMIQQYSELASVMIMCRILIEFTSACCNNDVTTKVGDFDVERLMVMAKDVMELGGWSDAIKWDAIEPYVRITPLGDVQINHHFHDEVANQFHSRATSMQYEDAQENYEKNFSDYDVTPKIESQLDQRFTSAWYDEFGFSIDETRQFCDLLENIGYEKGKFVFEITQDDLLTTDLEHFQSLSKSTRQKIMERFSMPKIKGWRNCGKEFSDNDFHPWRYRRKLSPLKRPLISGDDNTYIIAPGMFRDAFGSMFVGFYEGNFKEQDCMSSSMRSWIGKKANEDGTAFEKKVGDRLEALGWRVERGQYLSQFSRNGEDRNLGDCDIIAQKGSRIVIFECKDLIFQKTLGEIAMQIAEYRGTPKKGGKADSLLKHLNRVKAARNITDKIEKFFNVSVKNEIESVIVFSNPVPMQYAWKDLQDKARIMTFNELDLL